MENYIRKFNLDTPLESCKKELEKIINTYENMDEFEANYKFLFANCLEIINKYFTHYES